jgi:osmotically-inducible protein OsmY
MKHIKRFSLPVLSLCGVLALSLASCTPIGLAVGAGATVGTSAAQEGGLSRAFSDAKIQTQINDLWFRSNVDMFRKLDMTINQGRVLLTGVVQDPEHRVEAVRLAWQANGVQQVINEIRVDEGAGVVGYAKDIWITTRLRTAITLDKAVQSINYNIDTVKGTVYLMGAAQDRLELNRVIETARAIENVVRVVSYVKLVGEQPDPGVLTDNAVRDDVGSDSNAGAY